MRSLFVMDPLDRIQVAGDSTFAVMAECTRRGWPCWYCTLDGLHARQGRGRAAARPVRAHDSAPFFTEEGVEELDLGDFDVVWMRKDPPFDMDYVLATYILDLAPPSTLMVNDPAALKLYNEKTWAMHFAALQPDTLLAREPERLEAFVRERQGRTVLKPWDGMAGLGVLVTHATDRNLKSMIETLTRGGRRHIIAQAFVEGADQGDKRILLFDGEPVSHALLRVPTAVDWRGNMHVGATVEAVPLTDRDREICSILSPHLVGKGMPFVGIDVIAGTLTEINITSPTGIRELDHLTGRCLEAELVDAVQRRARRQESP